MNYNCDYFIRKFEAIPDELWLIGNYTDWYNKDRHCALGHCGRDLGIHNEESDTLVWLFKEEIVSFVNDGREEYKKYGETPKQRILAALYDIRDKEIEQANITEANKIITSPMLVTI